jgi:tetratricopeptide (TPR) repeat protein
MSTALYELYQAEEDPVEKARLLDEAEFYVDRSLKIYPTYLSANQMKSGYVAARYMEHRDINKLLADFEAILRVRPQVEYIRQFMEWVQTRVDREPVIDWYYRMCYELLIKQKQLYPLAVTYLKIAEKFTPDDPRILFALGKGLYLGGDQVSGQQYLDRAYALNPMFRNVQ